MCIIMYLCAFIFENVYVNVFNLLAKWVFYQLQTYDMRQTENIQNTEINHRSMGGELQHPKKWIHDGADDQRCSIQESGTTGDEDNYEKSLSGKRPGRIGVCVVCHNRQKCMS